MKRALLIFLFPTVISILAIIGINLSNKPEVVHVPQAYGPGTGYQLQPEQFTVTASPSYKWHHGTSNGFKIFVGFLLFVVSGAYVYWVDREFKKGSMVILAIAWLGGAFLIFGSHAFRYYEIQTFRKTISVEKYELHKSDLDKIFDE